MPFTADDAEGQARLLAFAQGLQQLGWAVGGNLRIDTRWSAGDAEPNRTYAAELLALTPDVILANGTPEVRALQQVTRSVPIVFANAADPVGQGFVASLPRPAGNITGFMPVVPENSIRVDSRDEAESAHHPTRCLHSFSCLGYLSPTCSGRGAGLKSRTSFSGISSILL